MDTAISTPNKKTLLGKVTVPSGVVLLIDFGLMDLWTHDQPPLISPGILNEQDLDSANNGADFVIEGEDALRAGKHFDRQPHPLYLYDIPRTSVEEITDFFHAFVQQHGYRARLVELPCRVPPLARARQTIARENKAGEVFLHGMHAVAVAGIPTDRTLLVEGAYMGEGPYAKHWREIALVISAETETTHSTIAGYVTIDMARLMFCDLEAAGHWQHMESIDGLADFIFWGKDAFRLARRFEAPLICDRIYGFADKPLDQMLQLAIQVQKHLEHHRMVAATDFRPHSDHWRMLTAISGNESESGEISLADSLCCGFMTSWSDGFFPVYLDYGPDDQLRAIRIHLGTEETIKGMRLVNRFAR